MDDPKVIYKEASGTVATSGSAVPTIVSSGTAFVPVAGRTDVMQPVVIPRLEIGPQRFREEFARITSFVHEVAMERSPEQPGFYVDEIELRLDVTAEGGLRVLGSGVDASAAAGIRVVFRRGKSRGS